MGGGIRSRQRYETNTRRTNDGVERWCSWLVGDELEGEGRGVCGGEARGLKGEGGQEGEEKNRKKSGPPMETSRLMTILEEGCWLVVDESRLSCSRSRGPVQRIDGAQKGDWDLSSASFRRKLD